MTPRDRLLTAWREDTRALIPAPPETDAPFIRVGVVYESRQGTAVVPVVIAWTGKPRGLVRAAAAWYDPVTAWLSAPIYVQGNAAVVEQVLRTNGMPLDEKGVRLPMSQETSR